MVLLIFLSLLLVLLLWLLLAPIELRIDSRRALFRLRWRTLAGVELVTPGDEPALRWRIGPWGRDFYPLRAGRRQAKPGKAKKERPKRRRRGWKGPSWRQVKSLLRAIRIRTCRLDLDTGDYVRNARLFPLFYFLRGRRAEIRINFQGRNELDLWIETSIIHLLVAFFRGVLFKKR